MAYSGLDGRGGGSVGCSVPSGLVSAPAGADRIIQPVIAGLSQVGFVFKLADYLRQIAPGTK